MYRIFYLNSSSARKDGLLETQNGSGGEIFDAMT